MRQETQSPPEKESTGIIPQLLTPATEDEAETYLRDKCYCAQEKKDGKRLFLRSDGARVEGINRKGFIVDISPLMEEGVIRLGAPVLLDGEAIGDVFHAFGILEWNSENLRNLPYGEMHKELRHILKGHDSVLRALPMYVSESDKRALFKRLKKENREGIVFKSLSAPYFPGRDPLHIKCKFFAAATVVVLGVNAKRSVRMGVLNTEGDLVFVGNVTIPPNHDIPAKGNLIEVRYLYAYRNGSLFQPTYQGVRDDIDFKECLQSQLKYMNKDEEEKAA